MLTGADVSHFSVDEHFPCFVLEVYHGYEGAVEGGRGRLRRKTQQQFVRTDVVHNAVLASKKLKTLFYFSVT